MPNCVCILIIYYNDALYIHARIQGEGGQIDNFVFEGGGRVQGINLEHFDYQRSFHIKSIFTLF